MKGLTMKLLGKHSAKGLLLLLLLFFVTPKISAGVMFNIRGNAALSEEKFLAYDDGFHPAGTFGGDASLFITAGRFRIGPLFRADYTTDTCPSGSFSYIGFVMISIGAGCEYQLEDYLCVGGDATFGFGKYDTYDISIFSVESSLYLSFQPKLAERLRLRLEPAISLFYSGDVLSMKPKASIGLSLVFGRSHAI